MKALLIAEKPSLMRTIQDVYRQINLQDTITFKSFAGHVITHSICNAGNSIRCTGATRYRKTQEIMGL